MVIIMNFIKLTSSVLSCCYLWNNIFQLSCNNLFMNDPENMFYLGVIFVTLQKSFYYPKQFTNSLGLLLYLSLLT